MEEIVKLSASNPYKKVFELFMVLSWPSSIDSVRVFVNAAKNSDVETSIWVEFNNTKNGRIQEDFNGKGYGFELKSISEEKGEIVYAFLVMSF